jgi:hypothetical protein
MNKGKTHKKDKDSRYKEVSKKPKSVNPYEEIDITESKNEDMPYFPIIYNIPSSKDSIFTKEIDPVFTINSAPPLFNKGYHFYNHATKDKMDIIDQLPTKREFYRIIGRFESQVDGSPENSVNTYAHKYFGIDKGIPDILSRGFYKFWELIIMFNLIPTDKSNFISAHLAEGPGAFVQATMFFRDMFTDKKHTSKNDKYYAIGLHSDNIDKKYIPQMDQKFVDYYSKEKPKRIEVHKAYSTKDLQLGGKRDTGDLTKIRTILNFGGNFKDAKADLITADSGLNWGDENTQEQNSLMLIIGEICSALLDQATGGIFVIRLFETFTNVTNKLIKMLSEYYDTVHGAKPLMSRESTAEKYIICKGYKGLDKTKNNIKKLLQVLKDWETIKKKDNRFLFDIFPDYVFDSKFSNTMLAMNTEIANKQIEAINKMVIFINKQDYYGSDYNKFKDVQIKSSEFWIKTYFPENNTDMKNIMQNTIKIRIANSESRIDAYQKELE